MFVIKTRYTVYIAWLCAYMQKSIQCCSPVAQVILIEDVIPLPRYRWTDSQRAKISNLGQLSTVVACIHTNHGHWRYIHTNIHMLPCKRCHTAHIQIMDMHRAFMNAYAWADVCLELNSSCLSIYHYQTCHPWLLIKHIPVAVVMHSILHSFDM